MYHAEIKRIPLLIHHLIDFDILLTGWFYITRNMLYVGVYKKM